MNAKINKILVGVDFSEQSPKVLLYASTLAEKTDAEIIVLSVINQRNIDAAVVYSRLVGAKAIGAKAIGVESFTKMEFDRRKARIKELLEEAGLSNIKQETKIRVGHPYKEILKAIQEFNIDLIVLGTRGKTSHEDYAVLTGSVAERVFRHSPVPVLSFRG
jgi:nucleotide-binding universal stress UspA family protein